MSGFKTKVIRLTDKVCQEIDLQKNVNLDTFISQVNRFLIDVVGSDQFMRLAMRSIDKATPAQKLGPSLLFRQESLEPAKEIQQRTNSRNN